MKIETIQLRFKALGEFIEANWPVFIFTVLCLLGIFFHECWRDELQALLIAKAPLSLSQLLGDALKYEGHPALWYLLLKVFSPFGVQPLGMQLLNAFLMIGAVSIFWWHFPLERKLKSLLVFNYYFIFEFGLIARSYTLGIFLTFYYLAFCDSKGKGLRLSAYFALLLMMHTSIYTWILALGILAYRIWGQGRLSRNQSFYEAAFGLFFALLALLQMLPASDSSFADKMTAHFDFDQLLSVFYLVGEVFLPVLALTRFPNLWSQILPFPNAVIIFRFCFFAFLMGIFAYRLSKRDKSLAFVYSASCLLLLCFSYFRFVGSLRHMAHLLLMWAAFYGLSAKKQTWTLSKETQNIIYVFAFLSAANGATLYFLDVIFPFSDAKKASQVISPTDKLVVAIPDYIGASVSGYLNGKSLFYSEGKRWGTFTRWDKKRLDLATFEKPLGNMLHDQGGGEAIIVTNQNEVADKVRAKMKSITLYQSEACIVPDECYVVLKVRE